MATLSKFLRGSCAIVTGGALALSSLSATAQNLPPPDQLPRGAQLPPPPAAQLPPPPTEQPPPPQPAAQQLGQGELDKLVAPIALYPDDLVAQILTASTYPIEVVEAERWVGAHTDLHGEALQDAMQQQLWDPSVRGLTAVPQVLALMNDQLDWTQQLGEAFLAQPNDVSNAIQQLRQKAEATGSLKTSDRIKVSTVAAAGPPPPPVGPPPPGIDPALLPPPPPPDYIVIEPVDPAVYYVPIYDPAVVYGPWLWPAYRPFYWYPPGYVLAGAVIGFGVGSFVGSALWCHYNWGGGWGGHWGGPVTINVVRYNQFNRTHFVAERNGFSNWQFSAAHRGAVGFHNAALRQQFGGPNSLQGARGALQGTPGRFHSLQGTPGQFHSLQGTPGQFHSPQGTPGQARSFQGNPSFTHGGPAPLNAHVNTNAHLNTNANVNANLNVNRQNQNPNLNRSFNGNPNASFNRNGNGGGNVNRNANFTRNAGPPGGRGGPPGGKSANNGKKDHH